MTDKRPDWFSWYECLEPGEQLLWEGHPREGAGWRCILHDGRAPVPRLLALIGALGGIALVAFGRNVPDDLVFFLVGVFLMVAILGFLTGLDLASMRYAVTDRRSLAVELMSRKMLTVSHDEAKLIRRMTRCGTLINVGYGRKLVWRGTRNWKRVEGESDRGHLIFRALEPETSPFDLLARLIAGHRPPSVGDPPWQPGFTR